MCDLIIKNKNSNYTVADFVADFLHSKGIKSIFMLTGYGAMYLNDSIVAKKIKYYAARNEAAAPMMDMLKQKMEMKFALFLQA